MKHIAAVFLSVLMCQTLSAADRISVVRLIANGEKYQGQQVIVSGYLNVASDGVVAIYLDEASARAGVTVNSVALILEGANAKFNIDGVAGKYVQLDATFVFSPRNFSFAGVLKNIGAIHSYPLVKYLPEHKEILDESGRKY